MSPAIPAVSESIFYVHSGRARRLRLTLKPDLSVRVTVPEGVSMDKAKAFVASHHDWIQTHRRKIAHQRHSAPLVPPPIDLKTLDLRGGQDELFRRLEGFSKQHDLPYRRAAFRCQKTLWGSCSHRRHISLNINILLLPPHLQDYILLHELTHIRHPNHSRAFWAELDGFCGGRAKTMRSELKQYRIYLRPNR